jgi:ABC-2 type transport system ATP-binding protein
MTFGAHEVSVRFGDLLALDRVTVDTDAGSLTAVVGGDGAGKSTLLRTVVGRVAPTSGRVLAPPPEQIGYQPSSGGTWPDLTVAENMDFVGGTYGLRGARLARRAAELTERAGLTAARDRLARDLSGGMRTKLGFCLAMLHEPTLLVLDEPSTGVDPVSRVELWRLLSEAAAAGTAVLLSTSYLDEAERATSVLVLEDGQTLLSGTPEEVVAGSPGVVVRTAAATRPEFAWRHADGFREWWPQAPDGGQPVEVDLEDVAIVASLTNHRGAS